jgi:hypothetical protein
VSVRLGAPQFAGCPKSSGLITINAPEAAALIPAAAVTAPAGHCASRAQLKAVGSDKPTDPPHLPCPAPDVPLPPPVPAHTSRLEDILAVMGTDPQRDWHTTELATLLRLDRNSLSGGLNRWARRAILVKTGRGTFKIPDGPPVPSRRAVRREDVLALMRTDPDRSWHPRDIAAALNTVTPNTLAMHMSAWARKNLLVKVAPATYKLPAQPPASPLVHLPIKANRPSAQAA